jgi:hypothetical protein
MKTQSLLLRMVILNLIVMSIAISAFAQSTNQSSPTVMNSPQYIGKGPSKETTYFFSFTGGPGEVEIKLELKAKTYSTFARLEVLDAGMHTMATLNMNAATSTGPTQEIKQIDVDEKQTVILKLTLDSNLASYKIDLSGAVTWDSAGNGSGSNGSNGKLKFSSGQHINVQKKGTLIIKMNDGTTQEFDLATVESVDVLYQ